MKIIKSFRKTISLKIDETGELIVKSPLFASKKTIENFIEKNKNWISEKKYETLERIREFTAWEKFYFFWEQYELIFDDKNEDIYFDWLKFFLHKRHKIVVKQKLIDFYKKESKKYIIPKVKEVAELNDLKYNDIKITSAKTRWWSCTSKWNLNFSYRLIMAPLKSVDYVIVHELAHLKEMNHSPNFWNVVEELSNSLYPWNYKIHQKWLKDNWNKLMY